MEFQKSVVAIFDTKNNIVGTGFVARENLILTCAHVVEQATAGLDERVTIRFSDNSRAEAMVDQRFFSPSYEKDVALLRVDSLPPGIPPLPLGNAAGSAGHDFYAYGYAIVADVQGIGARGKIVDIVDSGRLAQLTSQEPDHGMSGGPVLDEQRRVVIGMVVKGKNQANEDKSLRNIYTTFATSTEVIRDLCPELQLTEICPYRSLDVFNEEDALFFFGRERVVQKLLDSLKREPRFLAVLGPSGSGKSSVVRAGLISALRQGKVPGSQKWDVVTIRPANDPFEQMANTGFINPKVGLESSVKSWLADRPDKTRLMLFIDQFEEVLVSTPKDVRQKFITELAQLLDAPLAITVVLSLRDDFYSRFLHDAAALSGWLERGLINTPLVLEQDDLRAMIVEPANSVGLTFDEGLADVIITDACETDRSKGLARSTILPLLEFALTQLWELRKDGRLTHDAYKNIGGTTGSLSQWADRVYYEFGPNERKLTEQIFCRLVHLGDEKEQIPDTRRVIPINELVVGRKKGNDEQVVGTLVQARLLSAHREYQTGQQFVEIIHDALLREWKLLDKWIDDFRHREQIAREKRRRLVVFGLSIGLVVMIALAVAALLQRNEALRQAQIALAHQLVAQAETINATRNSKQMIAVLLAIRSMQIIPSSDASQVLLNNTAAHWVFRTTQDGVVRCVAFSQDGKYVVSGGGNTLLVQDAATGREIVRMKHEDLVYSVAFSPDSRYIVSGSRDRTVRIWDAVNGNEIARLSQDGAVNSVTFSPDGKYVAAGAEQIIRIWKASTGTEVTRMKINTGPIFSVVYSRDGKYLVSGDNKNARVWDATIGKEISRMKFDKPVHTVAISPDGVRVVSGSDDYSVRVWDAATGKAQARAVHTGAVTSVAFSPDGKYVASGSRDETARVWDAESGGEIARMTHDGSVFFIAFSPDGKYVVSGSSDKTARVWDAIYGDELARMTHGSQVYAAAFSPDGKYVVSGGDDNLVRVWETITSAEITRMAHAGRVYSVAFSKDGKYAASGSSDHTARVRNIRDDIEIFRVLHDDTVYSVSFSRDGKYVASGGGHNIIVMDVATGKEIARMTHEDLVNSIDFSPDGKYLVSGSYDFTARVWDLSTGMEIARMKHDDKVESVKFSPDSRSVASGSFDHTVRVWEGLSGKEIARMAHDSQVYCVAFSPDGLYLVSGDAKVAQVWDAMTGSKISQTVHTNFVYSVAFSPNGKNIVSGGGHIVKVWEVLTGKEIVNLNHDGVVNSVAFSPDSKYVVSGDDKAARVWDAISGKEIARMSHNNLVKSAAFSPDGKYVISGGVDRTARVWPWRPEDLIMNTCANLTRNLMIGEWKLYFGEEPYQAICPNLPIESEPSEIPTP
jgi:WD40 repeat protein